MHIAFIDSWPQNAADASETNAGTSGLAQALRDQGHRVTRFAPFTHQPNSLTIRRLFFNLTLPPLLRSLHYDLVVGFDIDGFAWSRHTANVPYVCVIKGVLAEALQHDHGRTRAWLQAWSRLERRNARNADLVLTTSAYARAAIARHYGVPGRRVRLVPEGINLADWQQIGNETPCKSDGFTLTCVARQYPRKHITDLLQALVIVRERVPQAHAIVIGDGPEHTNLKAMATELGLGTSVQFLGALSNSDVARWHRCADIFCLPSIQESTGKTFLEAMASGLPIVATRSAAIPEVVPRNRAGLLVPPASPQLLAAALLDLLENPDKRRAFGTYGQRHAQQYDWERVARLFLAAVSPLVQAQVSV